GDETRVVSASTLHVAGRVSTVDHVSVLIGPRASDGAATEIAFTSASGTVEAGYRHRLKEQQRRSVTAQGRQLREQVRIQHVAHGRIEYLKLKSCASYHFHGFGSAAHFQNDVYRRRFRDLHLYAAHDRLAKALAGNGYGVISGTHGAKRVL